MSTDDYVASSSGHLLVPGHAATGKRSTRVLHLSDGSMVDVDPDLPPIPPGLLHLDDFAGRAVPYVAWRTLDGNVDLTEVDGQRYLDCLHERTCGMCALPLGYWLAWPVAADSAAAAAGHRAQDTPAMHRPCASYAARAWWTDRPWLYIARGYTIRASTDPKRPRVAYAATAHHVDPVNSS